MHTYVEAMRMASKADKLQERWLDAAEAMESLPWEEVEQDLKTIRTLIEEKVREKTT
jgi:hypothetical protein